MNVVVMLALRSCSSNSPDNESRGEISRRRAKSKKLVGSTETLVSVSVSSVKD